MFPKCLLKDAKPVQQSFCKINFFYHCGGRVVVTLQRILW